MYQIMSQGSLPSRTEYRVKNCLKIRLGSDADLFRVSELFTDSVRELCKYDYEQKTIDLWVASKTVDSRLQFINNDSLWVAELGGEIAGYLISIPGEILALFVGSSYTGKGIGLALGKWGIEIAKGDGLRDVKLESTITAVDFYKKLGFRETTRGYYSHDNSDLKLPIVNMVLLSQNT